jgi:hypothetical protein
MLEAARGVRTYKMSYWDAQIWASARLHQIPVIFSEDFNGGAVMRTRMRCGGEREKPPLARLLCDYIDQFVQLFHF